MNYSPHILEKLTPAVVSEVDGNPVVVTPQAWVNVAPCRCDDAGNKTFYGANGIAYSPLYKIVTDKGIILEKGQKVRALRQDGTVRGEGIVDRPSECNLLNYQVLWLS